MVILHPYLISYTQMTLVLLLSFTYIHRESSMLSGWVDNGENIWNMCAQKMLRSLQGEKVEDPGQEPSYYHKHGNYNLFTDWEVMTRA